MASTYENDLRLEEMATGENSGSWGTKTNTNLELIADAFSYGTETIADADTTITIADGAADAARSLALKINSSADLTTTRTITLAPNTTSKVWIIENNTSGGQTLTISAGSGSNITLLNGQTKIIATDGIGAGSNVVELTQDIAIADLFIDDDLSLQSDGAIINFGADDDITLTHAADTSLTLGGAGSTTGLVVNNTATDGDPFLAFALSGTQKFTMGVDDGDSDKFKIGTSAIGTDTRLTITSSGAVGVGEDSPDVFFHIKTADSGGVMTIESTNASSSSGPNLNLLRTSASPADDDNIGKINFQAYDDGSNNTVYASIQTLIRDTTDTTEDGRMLLNTILNGALVSRVELDNDETVINESSYDLDFRVESDSNANMLFVDGGANHVNIGTSTDYGSTLNVFTTGTDALEIVSDNGNASAGPYLDITRKSSSPADGDFTGAIRFLANSDAAETIVASINTVFDDVSNASEDSSLFFKIRQAGAQPNVLDFSPTETVVNNDSYNRDFRVESDSNANMLFVDAGNNSVGIGTNSPAGDVQIITETAGTVFNVNHNTGGSYPKASGIGLGATSTSLTVSSNGGTVSFAGGAGIYAENTAASGNPTNLVFWTNLAGTPSESARIDKSAFSTFQGSAIFNEAGMDQDFRVESDTNANAFFVDASQDNVGIGGTPNINTKLDVYQPITANQWTGRVVSRSDTGGAVWLGTYTSGTQSTTGIYSHTSNLLGWDDLYINAHGDGSGGTSSGGTGQTIHSVGTWSHNGNVVINDASFGSYDFRIESDNKTNMFVVDAGADSVIFGNAGGASGTMVRINHDVDGSNLVAALHIQGAGYTGFHWLDTTAYYIGQNSEIRQMRIYSGSETAGVALVNGGTSWGTFSDERLKENVEPVENALQSLSGLRTVKYHLKDVDGPEDKKKIGVIAQDLVGVLDEVIDPTFRPGDDTEYMGVRYTELVPVLIKAIQEQQALIETLEARIAALENA